MPDEEIVPQIVAPLHLGLIWPLRPIRDGKHEVELRCRRLPTIRVVAAATQEPVRRFDAALRLVGGAPVQLASIDAADGGALLPARALVALRGRSTELVVRAPGG